MHTGHFLVRASSPVYQLLTHVSQPSNVLQHLLKIGGAAIGAWRQILHLNASIINCFKARGTELVLSSSFISRTTDAISAMSSLISSKVSLWILDHFFGPSSTSSSESSRMIAERLDFCFNFCSLSNFRMA